MAENIYECLMILDANAYARDPGGAANNVKTLIETAGGDVKASRLWNEQKLAYPINGRHKGAYWLSYFTMETSKLVAFNRACQLNDLVMRHMVIKLDPRISDKMIAIAKGEGPVAADAVEEDTADKSEKADELVETAETS